MRANRTKACIALPFLLALPACQGVRPAKAEFVDRLERPTTDAARAELERAERELAGGQWQDALVRLQALRSDNPECSRIAILARRAVALAPDAEREGLVAEVRETIRAERGQVDAAMARASLSFAEALFAETPRKEEILLRRAIEEEPNHYYALCKLGERFWRRGELEAARNTLEKAVSLRRDLAEGWMLLAQVAEDRGSYKKASRYYETYLGLRPLDRRVQLEYARLLVQMLRDGKRAEEILAPMHREDPSNLEVGLGLGLALFLQGRHADAERLYLTLLERWPREARVLLSLGNLYHGALAAPKQALQTYRWLMAQRASGDLLAMLGQSLFVPARIREIEAGMKSRDEVVPPPPTSVDDIFRLAAATASRRP